MTVYDKSQHERINAIEYPGTRQLCASCNEPTGRCEEDSIYLEPQYEHQDSLGPLCNACFDEIWNYKK